MITSTNENDQVKKSNNAVFKDVFTIFETENTHQLPNLP
jgi:hypothetical protein